MTNLYAKNKDFIDQFIPDELGEPVLVDITNVAYYTQNQETDYFEMYDFILDLPWLCTWFEYKRPNHVVRNGEKITGENPTDEVYGILAMYNKETDTNNYVVFSTIQSEGTFEWQGWEEPDGIRWYGSRAHSRDKEKLEGNDFGQVVIAPFLKKNIVSGNLTEQQAKKIVQNELPNVYYATTFCHCNNVEYYEKNHPEALQKANKKRGKIPQETYRILDIGGLKKQAKSESNEECGELQTALHICRGHFKTYTEDNPLFGKHTGTYWWPMHKRGSEDNGKVNKDYNITT